MAANPTREWRMEGWRKGEGEGGARKELKIECLMEGRETGGHFWVNSVSPLSFGKGKKLFLMPLLGGGRVRSSVARCVK